jgi:hypothetical protein
VELRGQKRAEPSTPFRHPSPRRESQIKWVHLIRMPFWGGNELGVVVLQAKQANEALAAMRADRDSQVRWHPRVTMQESVTILLAQQGRNPS